MKPGKRLILFFLPGTVLYLALFVYPTLTGLYYSITDWDGLSPSYRYVGADNYARLAEDIVFRKSFANNLKFMLAVVLVQTAVSLALALQLTKKNKRTVALRALFFVPTVLSSVSVGFIWTFIYDPSLGALNGLLEKLGLGALTQNWLGDMNLAIFSVAAVQAWAHIGQMIVLYVAGLQAIPPELLEAARLDGGTRGQVFRKVTWPLLAPAAAIVVSYTTIQSFKAFDLVFTMTGGGPAYSTEILSTFIYGAAFTNGTFGFASAASVVFLALISLITYLQFRLLRADRVSY
ncbi:carbohydrate ABC transporter permease [Cohnella thailandensis]|uniref:Sugar ABC transporter permease n=1 Tax=Cohnella thailandensis TaxID=557557 RepID=A0A841T1K4_9BACL|nr:sugar ABC transporter permease [Cohnella thailandensis]MBB6637432.1 sugar ABC transporter permease [Cohnella thailandensis]MBP1976762.1 raffinose/stachyose/melibiose transport system permease protein [Cohnella thailandensis]